MKKTLVIMAISAFGFISNANAGACDNYIDCVCDWSDELSKKTGDSSQKAQCKQIKTAYKGMPASSCTDALKMFKTSLKQSAASYKALGVKIPSSCK